MSTQVSKIGIIGVGGRGVECFGDIIKNHPGAQIVALADTNTIRLEEAEKFLETSINKYTDISIMLKTEKLDAVIITTPDYLHEEHALLALKNNVNVLIDKPLATTVKACQNILKTAETFNKVAMLGFNLRHMNTLVKLKDIIQSGTLGKIFLIENREYYDGGKTYMARWNRKYEFSGGLWIHKGSHDFDVIQWLLDFPKPVKVTATAGINALNPEGIPFDVAESKPVGPTCAECSYNNICPDVTLQSKKAWGKEAQELDQYAKDLCIYTSDKDTHDNGISTVEYEGGIRASHIECFVTSYTDRLYTVIGDKGMAEVSLHDRTIKIRPRWSQETILHQLPEAEGGHGGADTGLVDTFIKTIQGDLNNTSTLEHGMLSTAVGQAAELSVRENRTVFIKELFQ